MDYEEILEDIQKRANKMKGSDGSIAEPGLFPRNYFDKSVVSNKYTYKGRENWAIIHGVEAHFRLDIVNALVPKLEKLRDKYKGNDLISPYINVLINKYVTEQYNSRRLPSQREYLSQKYASHLKRTIDKIGGYIRVFFDSMDKKNKEVKLKSVSVSAKKSAGLAAKKSVASTKKKSVASTKKKSVALTKKKSVALTKKKSATSPKKKLSAKLPSKLPKQVASPRKATKKTTVRKRSGPRVCEKGSKPGEFFRFMNAKRELIKQKHKVTKRSEVATIASAMWRKLKDVEKAVYCAKK